jgi:TetR/AcrR family transcriptional regulator, transcriptional repressor for nem operon
MRQNTRQKILEVGAEIIHLKGYNHTGLQEILQATGVPKGSFYNYFKSKEDFGLQVIDFFANLFASMAGEVIKEESLTPLQKIERMLDRFIDFFKSKDYAYGCPIGNLSQEMGDLSQAFRKKLRRAADEMVDIYRGLLEQARIAGEISADLDIKETAYFIVSSWHGALVRMKIEKGPRPLKNHKRFIFDHVLRR